MSIKELVKGNHVQFDSYRQGVFYYILNDENNLVTHNVTAADGIYTELKLGTKYQFPVPINDIGTATLKRVDKAITFMRWIRKAIEDKTLIKVQL